MQELEENTMAYSGNEGEEGGGSEERLGSGVKYYPKSALRNTKSTTAVAEDSQDVNSNSSGITPAPQSEAQSKEMNDNYDKQQKYLDPGPRDEASGLGEKTK